MKKTSIGKTEIFEFFGIKESLFVSTELKGDLIKRYVNKEEELEEFSIHIQQNKNCAIVGEQGTGKSSFLLKLMDSIKSSRYVAYQQFTLKQEGGNKVTEHFLRTILKNIINVVLENDELLKGLEVDVLFEAQRLEHTILLESYQKKGTGTDASMEGGIKGGAVLDLLLSPEFKAKLKTKRTKEEGEGEKKEYPLHTETTLREAIERLTESMEHPIVLFIDELDKVGRFPLESPKWDEEVIKILELSRDIMNNNNLVFVFTLQEKLREKLEAAMRNEGQVSILGLIPYFDVLGEFDLEMAVNVVDRSLQVAGYGGTKEDLFEEGVIEIVLSVAKGNPRLFMNYLSILNGKAFLRRSRKITQELLIEVLEKRYYGRELTPGERAGILKTKSVLK